MNTVLTVLTIVVLGALVLRLLGWWIARHDDRQRRVILELLEQGPAGGLALVMRSDGRLGRGTVYLYLSRLEDQHLVTSVPMADRSGRRLYALTDAGRRVQQRLEVMP